MGPKYASKPWALAIGKFGVGLRATLMRETVKLMKVQATLTFDASRVMSEEIGSSSGGQWVERIDKRDEWVVS